MKKLVLMGLVALLCLNISKLNAADTTKKISISESILKKEHTYTMHIVGKSGDRYNRPLLKLD